MTFADTFKDLRSRRRIPMRFFEEKVGIHASYVYGIEKENVLPSPEKLEQLASVFVEVAAEQEAVDPEADARRLREARETTVFERQGLDPKLVKVLLLFREMDPDVRAELMEPQQDALATFMMINRQERGGLARLIQRIRTLVESFDEPSRSAKAAQLAEEVEKSLDAAMDAVEHADAESEPEELPAARDHVTS